MHTPQVALVRAQLDLERSDVRVKSDELTS